MNPAVFLVAVLIAAASIGLWLSLRLPRLIPRSGYGAVGCFALAWLIPGISMPLVTFAIGRMPVGTAILLTVFPAFLATFTLTALGLRYLAGLAGHAIR